MAKLPSHASHVRGISELNSPRRIFDEWMCLSEEFSVPNTMPPKKYPNPNELDQMFAGYSNKILSDISNQQTAPANLRTEIFKIAQIINSILDNYSNLINLPVVTQRTKNPSWRNLDNAVTKLETANANSIVMLNQFTSHAEILANPRIPVRRYWNVLMDMNNIFFTFMKEYVNCLRTFFQILPYETVMKEIGENNANQNINTPLNNNVNNPQANAYYQGQSAGWNQNRFSNSISYHNNPTIQRLLQPNLLPSATQNNIQVTPKQQPSAPSYVANSQNNISIPTQTPQQPKTNDKQQTNDIPQASPFVQEDPRVQELRQSVANLFMFACGLTKFGYTWKATLVQPFNIEQCHKLAFDVSKKAVVLEEMIDIYQSLKDDEKQKLSTIPVSQLNQMIEQQRANLNILKLLTDKFTLGKIYDITHSYTKPITVLLKELYKPFVEQQKKKNLNAQNQQTIPPTNADSNPYQRQQIPIFATQNQPFNINTTIQQNSLPTNPILQPQNIPNPPQQTPAPTIQMAQQYQNVPRQINSLPIQAPITIPNTPPQNMAPQQIPFQAQNNQIQSRQNPQIPPQANQAFNNQVPQLNTNQPILQQHPNIITPQAPQNINQSPSLINPTVNPQLNLNQTPPQLIPTQPISTPINQQIQNQTQQFSVTQQPQTHPQTAGSNLQNLPNQNLYQQNINQVMNPNIIQAQQVMPTPNTPVSPNIQQPQKPQINNPLQNNNSIPNPNIIQQPQMLQNQNVPPQAVPQIQQISNQIPNSPQNHNNSLPNPMIQIPQPLQNNEIPMQNSQIPATNISPNPPFVLPQQINPAPVASQTPTNIVNPQVLNQNIAPNPNSIPQQNNQNIPNPNSINRIQNISNLPQQNVMQPINSQIINQPQAQIPQNINPNSHQIDSPQMLTINQNIPSGNFQQPNTNPQNGPILPPNTQPIPRPPQNQLPAISPPVLEQIVLTDPYEEDQYEEQEILLKKQNQEKLQKTLEKLLKKQSQ